MDGWNPAPKQRNAAPLKGGCLQGVVRVSVKPRAQITIRIAEDIIEELGWQADATISIYVGSGSKSGMVRLVSDDSADARTARLFKLRTSRAMTIAFPAKIIPDGAEEFDVFTAPHAIEGDGLTINLATLVRGSHAV